MNEITITQQDIDNLPILPTKKGIKGRISKQLKQAIALMIYHALTRKEAAETVGMTDHGLYNALTKAHVKGYKNDVFRAFRNSTSERAFIRTNELAERAKSESVRLRANETLMGMDDNFIQKTQVNQHVTGEITHTPGYIIDLSEPDQEQGQLNNNQVIEAEVIEDQSQS